MRTRRSWRNQNILWRELFAPAPVRVFTTDERIDNLRRAIAGCLSPRSRKQLERDLVKLERKKRLDNSLVADISLIPSEIND